MSIITCKKVSLYQRRKVHPPHPLTYHRKMLTVIPCSLRRCDLFLLFTAPQNHQKKNKHVYTRLNPEQDRYQAIDCVLVINNWSLFCPPTLETTKWPTEDLLPRRLYFVDGFSVEVTQSNGKSIELFGCPGKPFTLLTPKELLSRKQTSWCCLVPTWPFAGLCSMITFSRLSNGWWDIPLKPNILKRGGCLLLRCNIFEIAFVFLRHANWFDWLTKSEHIHYLNLAIDKTDSHVSQDARDLLRLSYL